MNIVTLSGHLTKDVQITKSRDDMSIARFSIGVNRHDKDNTADFPNCIAFKNTADFLGRYGTKGRLLELQGRLQTGSYTDRDGKKVYTTDVIVDRCYFLDRREDDQAKVEQPESKPEAKPEPVQQSEPAPGPQFDITSDDLPF